MLKARLNSESGFTLVEGLVAGLILVIGILGGVSVFDTSRRESGTGERQQVAQAKAAAELERMRDIPYAQLATDSSQSWVSSGQDGDPTARIVNGSTPKLKVSSSKTEDLVRLAGSGIKPYSPAAQVDIGGAQFTASVYRFVSWRDVECRVVDLAPLKAAFNTRINALLTKVASVNSRTTSLLSKLVGGILSLPLLSNFKSDLQALQTTMTSLQAQLNALTTAVANLNELDPCDANLETIKAMNATLDALSPALTTLDTALLNANSAPNCTVVIVTVVCPTVPVNTSTLYSTARTQITAFRNEDWPGDVQGVVTSLGQLSSNNHTHNTKRVTVAVVVEPEDGSGPFKPVWATSVIADPDAEALGG
ncbi:MAG: hypothetical protein QOI31_2605 [Solirubrobacterales bacterium]|jgi:Tfp pilus assembly protein PilV|nr:hypothetical protein [Solirubrobacterales bacterium]